MGVDTWLFKYACTVARRADITPNKPNIQLQPIFLSWRRFLFKPIARPTPLIFLFSCS